MLSLEQESEIDGGLPLPDLGYSGPCRREDSNLHGNRAFTTSLSFSLRSSRTPAPQKAAGESMVGHPKR